MKDNYLMEEFRIDLKTFLGLCMPNQYSQTIRKKESIKLDFG